MALFRAGAVSSSLLRSVLHASSRSLSTGAEVVESKEVTSLKSMMNQMFTLGISSQIGSCMPLSNMRIGMQIHNIELRPGQGGKLVRSAGTSAKILTEPNRSASFEHMEPPNSRKSSKTKLSSERRRTWTKAEEKALIVALKELPTTGWKCENGFRNGYLVCLEKSLAKTFPDAGIRAEPHIYSKMHVWKKNYGNLSQLVRTSGFGWNSEAKMVSVDDEDVWKEYIKANSSAEKLRGKIWTYYDDWCEIFGKDRATGETSEDFITADHDELNLNGVGYERNKDTSEHGEETDILLARQPSSSSTGKKSISKKRRHIDSTGEKIVELMEAFCEQNKSLLSEFTKKIGVEYDLQTQRKTVYEVLGGIGELSVAQKVRLAKLLVNNSQELDLFFSLPNEAKVEMVHQILDDI